jgi:hypothetical protein
MITMMIKTVITPAIPPITAYSPLEDVSWITENKGIIFLQIHDRLFN